MGLSYPVSMLEHGILQVTEREYSTVDQTYNNLAEKGPADQKSAVQKNC